jgi:hypothetical protein
MLFHDLRRTASGNLRHAGLSESEAMATTGHKTTSIFKRYSIVSEGDLRDAIWRAQALALGERQALREGLKCVKTVANRLEASADERDAPVVKSSEMN